MKYIITESQYDNLLKENYEQEINLIKKVLNRNTFEGVCDYAFSDDDETNKVGSVIIVFSQDWYFFGENNDDVELNRKRRLIEKTKIRVRDMIRKYLGMDNVYVGSVIEECDSSINEQEEEVSKLQKLKDSLKKMDFATASRYVGGPKQYINILFDGDINKYFEENNLLPYYITKDGMNMYISDAIVQTMNIPDSGWRGEKKIGDFVWKSGGFDFKLTASLVPQSSGYITVDGYNDQKMWRVVGNSGSHGWGHGFYTKRETIGKRGRQQIFKQIIDKFGL